MPRVSVRILASASMLRSADPGIDPNTRLLDFPAMRGYSTWHVPPYTYSNDWRWLHRPVSAQRCRQAADRSRLDSCVFFDYFHRRVHHLKTNGVQVAITRKSRERRGEERRTITVLN